MKLLGIGQSADGRVSARPDANGEGMKLAIDRSMKVAGVRREQVAIVSGHGTGTAVNDRLERDQIGNWFGDCSPLLATKGIHGHSGGGASIQELVALKGVLEGSLDPAEACWAPDVGLRPLPSHRGARYGAKLAMAMGGINTCLIVGTGETASTHRKCNPPTHRFATIGRASFSGGQWVTPEGSVDGDGPLAVLMKSRRWRRLDLWSRLVAGTIALLLDCIRGSSARSDEIGIALATQFGPMLSWQAAATARLRGLKQEPEELARLSSFAPASEAASIFSLRGPVSCYIGRSHALENAFDAAAMTIQIGMAPAMLVVMADDYTGPLAQDTSFYKCSGIDIHEPQFRGLHESVDSPHTIPTVRGILLASAGLAAPDSQL
jgi:3-oxoacyl-(acyl-carrier-protein) synthase